jgi:hypothetical protein
LEFRGRDTIFALYLATLMVPLTVTVIPQFILMRTFGWTDTPWAMIVPGLFGTAFGTYLMRQFFRTLPADLEKAAIIDGCSPWQIYWKILLPHTKPAVIVLAVLTWVSVWNDFLWPLVMIQRDSIATLNLGLVRLGGERKNLRFECVTLRSTRSPSPLFDVNVVVTGERPPTLIVGEFAEMGESLEELSPRRTGGEQDQHRGRLVGLVVPAVNAAGRDVHEVVAHAVGPLVSVVELDGP